MLYSLCAWILHHYVLHDLLHTLLNLIHELVISVVKVSEPAYQLMLILKAGVMHCQVLILLLLLMMLLYLLLILLLLMRIHLSLDLIDLDYLFELLCFLLFCFKLCLSHFELLISTRQHLSQYIFLTL